MITWQSVGRIHPFKMRCKSEFSTNWKRMRWFAHSVDLHKMREEKCWRFIPYTAIGDVCVCQMLFKENPVFPRSIAHSLHNHWILSLGILTASKYDVHWMSHITSIESLLRGSSLLGSWLFLYALHSPTPLRLLVCRLIFRTKDNVGPYSLRLSMAGVYHLSEQYTSPSFIADFAIR